MSGPWLDDTVAEHVAHLHTVSLHDVLSGTVDRPKPTPRPLPGVEAVDATVGEEAVPIRRYRRTDGGADPRPAVVWAHGGAWVAGDLDMAEADAVSQRLCLALDAVVYSVDYRLAPQHTHPAALDDVVAAFDAATSDERIDPTRVALGGASAGGHLAAAASQLIRDRGGVQPAAIMLGYPATDPERGPYGATRPSVCPPILWFDEALAPLGFRLYLGGSTALPYAVPADGDLTGLPPTLVTTTPNDALADQAIEYVSALRAAGVAVEHHRVDGVLHGYLDLTGVADIADRALDRHIRWLAPWLDRPTDPRNDSE